MQKTGANKSDFITNLPKLYASIYPDIELDSLLEVIGTYNKDFDKEKYKYITPCMYISDSTRENLTYKDFFEDEGAMSPDDYAANELLKDELNDVLLELTDREEKVLRLRFGLDDGRTRTLEEVGREFNVTRERIRQIEAKALRKLKHPSRSKRLKDFLDR